MLISLLSLHNYHCCIVVSYSIFNLNYKKRNYHSKHSWNIIRHFQWQRNPRRKSMFKECTKCNCQVWFITMYHQTESVSNHAHWVDPERGSFWSSCNWRQGVAAPKQKEVLETYTTRRDGEEERRIRNWR